MKFGILDLKLKVVDCGWVIGRDMNREPRLVVKITFR